VDGGRPAQSRAGIESLSGVDLSDVRVHANSDKPAKLGALAYAQGDEIHLAPRQERSLPHEAWHVVQQRQRRAAPTLQFNGYAVNDDAGLEREAHVMGERALHASRAGDRSTAAAQPAAAPVPVVQRNIGFEYETNVNTYRAARALSDAERRTAGAFVNGMGPNKAYPPQAQRLGKGTVVVADMDGAHAKSDVGGTGLGSNLEFETDPFPETLPGRAALSRALSTIERFCALIEAEADVTPHMRSSHLALAFGGKAPEPLHYIRVDLSVSGNPQATVGVRL
jgi:hypothetical protein